MNHFGLSRSRRCDKNNVAIPAPSLQVHSDAPVVIEGAEYLDTILPVSSLTGNRMSLYEAMLMIGNEKVSRQLDAFLSEFPADNADSRMSDDDRVSLLASRLDTGTPVENERYAKLLSSVVQDVYDAYDKQKASSINGSGETIKFDKDDGVQASE